MGDVVQICHNCDKRYNCSGVDRDELWKIFENKYCPLFVKGKCFYCVAEALDDDSQCNYGMWPSGCPNFKAGPNIEEYEKNIVHDNDVFCEESESILDDMPDARIKARQRRKNTIRHKHRLARKAEENRHALSGPYFSERRNRVIISPRGSRSKWLKRQSNKRVRKLGLDAGALKKGKYRRLFDYWWELN
jgi:hypothetical protein